MTSDLHARVRDLESGLLGDLSMGEGQSAGRRDLSDDDSSTVAMAKRLHAEVDAACGLKETLETDFGAMKKRMAQRGTLREELEAWIKLMEAKIALGDQLRENLSLTEQARDENARCLEQATAELDRTSRERDQLADAKTLAETQLKEAHRGLVALDAKVSKLEARVSDIHELRRELVETKKELIRARHDLQRSREDTRDTKSKLGAAEVANNALELNLTTAREAASSQQGQIEELKQHVGTADSELVELRAKVDRQQAENASLTVSNQRLQCEIKTLGAWIMSMTKDLESSKQALRDIRTAAIGTTKRLQRRHSASRYPWDS